MTGTPMRLPGLLLVVLLSSLGLVGCGPGDDAGAPEAASPSGEEGTWGLRTWHRARLGATPDEVVVGFAGPDPDGRPDCVETYEPDTFRGTDGVLRLIVEVPNPMADVSCPTKPVEVTFEVADRDRLEEGVVIEAGGSAYRYRLTGDQFALVADSTPCGRADCSTPSPTPAPCTADPYRAGILRGVDGGVRITGEQACDGSFLITGIDPGSGGCPPSPGPSPCRLPKVAYFVARDGEWSVVTYGEEMTCAEVARTTEIRFPPDLCGAAGADGRLQGST